MDVPGYAIITGGASGIGAACAHAFAHEGVAGVALLDLNSEALTTTKLTLEQIAVKTRPEFVVETRVLDVTNEREVNETVSQIAKIFGRIDYLVNAAGILILDGKKFGEMDTRSWNKTLDCHVSGTMYVMRAVMDVMLQQEGVGVGPGKRYLQKGSVVNISSIFGVSARTRATPYITAKHAIVGLTKAASEDHAREGVRVNAVAPGFTETPMATGSEETKAFMEETIKRTVPMQRWASPEEVANAVLFLCGGRASFITGVVLPVDGGYTQGRDLVES